MNVPLGSHLYPVWYGTNRVPVDRQNEKKGYTSEPEPNSLTHYGKCFVIIPKSHTYGSTGSPWYKRWFKESDDRLSVKELLPLTENGFLDDVRKILANQHFNDKSILVYIHGYNVNFEEAAIRAAQIGFDLKVPGITAFYSWPSQGTLLGYGADYDNIQISEDSLSRFLVKMAKNTNADRVHIVAHSMGNYGLLRAMSGATAKATDSGIKFGQIFLAAPDVDVALFRQLANIYPKVSERTTLYVSAKDKAVDASSWLRKNQPRAGYMPPITIVKGIDTIEATNIDVGLLGHSYFSEAAGILGDMHNLLLHNDPPDKRPQLIRHTTKEGAPYWAVE
ncbi:alpha/beta hydrolase [Methyloglobulus morosus]|uniref:alpha/beta hydrolase n=1 Tax=Methyloglobulus morosus TaxID=1410681 RepID=UPI001F287DCB|nr:alpha/beta hydrolase [Methyloglobulus morosus]